MFSIILAIEPSYKVLLYENSYVYCYLGKCGWYKAISVYNERLYRYINLLSQHKLATDKDDFISAIENLICHNCVALVKVDLFDWVEKNINFKKRHLIHETLIIGFDDKKKFFWILDDDIYGYREHCVTYDMLYNAAEKYEIKSFNMNQKIPKYKFEIKNILNNKYQIINSILLKKYSSMWNIYDNASMIIDLVTEMSKIQNQHKASSFLLDYLYSEKYIEYKRYINAKEKIKNIFDDWERIKALTLKCYYNNSFEFEKVNTLSCNVFDSELIFWKEFYNNIEVKK